MKNFKGENMNKQWKNRFSNKKLNEEDTGKKYESFFRKASEQEISMLKKIGFYANEYTLVVGDAFNSIRQNRDLKFREQGFLECDSNVHYSSGDLDFEFSWYRESDELYSCADLIKDYPNIAKVYHLDDPEAVAELEPEELTKKDIENFTNVTVAYMDNWAIDYDAYSGDHGFGGIFVSFDYDGEKSITLEEFLKMNKMSREELLAAIVAESEGLGELYMEQIVNYQD